MPTLLLAVGDVIRGRCDSMRGPCTSTRGRWRSMRDRLRSICGWRASMRGHCISMRDRSRPRAVVDARTVMGPIGSDAGPRRDFLGPMGLARL